MRDNQAPTPEQRSGGRKSRVLSARLHPDDRYEREALDFVDQLLGEGYNMRQIITDAILHRQGVRPEMYRDDRREMAGIAEINAKLDAILSALEDQLPALLRSIRQSDPEGLRRFASSSGGDDLDEAFIENSRRAVRKTFKQRHER